MFIFVYILALNFKCTFLHLYSMHKKVLFQKFKVQWLKLILRWLLSWRSTKLSVKPLPNTCLGRDAQNLFSFFIFWQTPISDFCCFERESKNFPSLSRKVYFSKLGGEHWLGRVPSRHFTTSATNGFPYIGWISDANSTKSSFVKWCQETSKKGN